jgi:predicted negative regulator of RcsB-dependent stress response
MHFNLDEQEQLAELKAWWKQYGNIVTWLLIIVLAGWLGWLGWNKYQQSESMKGALLYEEIVKAIEAKDPAKIARAVADMKDKFSATPYAQMGALAAAKSTFEANDLKATKLHLQWVVDHGRNEEFIALARIRLAGVLLDEKAYDDGLKILAADFPEQFAALVADRKGDLLFAQNKTTEARAAFKLALDKTDVKNPARQLIQLKLDALGGADATAT